MDFSRAREKDLRYIKYEKSFLHNTALIASEGERVIGALEYEISNMTEAKIINSYLVQPANESEIFKGFIDEIKYWNPYLKRILHCLTDDTDRRDLLINCGFIKSDLWTLDIDNGIEIFRVDISEIVPEQLTVDKVKLDRVSSWIEKPEDVIISCVKIGDGIVSIDGHSRLVAALNKGFEHVYAYIETDNSNLEFYKTCLKWCEEQGVFTIQDLAKRVVSPQEHERIWIGRCQAYLKEKREKISTSASAN